MSKYCGACAEKLEESKFVQNITDDIFSSNITRQKFFYCDNQECPKVGIMLIMALTEKPDLTSVEADKA